MTDVVPETPKRTTRSVAAARPELKKDVHALAMKDLKEQRRKEKARLAAQRQAREKKKTKARTEPAVQAVVESDTCVHQVTRKEIEAYAERKLKASEEEFDKLQRPLCAFCQEEVEPNPKDESTWVTVV